MPHPTAIKIKKQPVEIISIVQAEPVVITIKQPQ